MYGMAKQGWHGSRKRANGRWQARWCDSEGVQSEGGFISKTQADAYALKMANEALNVKVGLAVIRKPIQDARKEFLERRTKENTRQLNQRRVDEFLAAMPEIHFTNQLTRNLIDRYAITLEQQEHNPGGQQHHLKIVRAFCNFCLDQKWISDSPFKGFVMPSSEYQGRELTANEWQAMVSISPVALNQHRDVDQWLNRAFRFGHSTMLRISQVWKLTPSDFVAPDKVRVLPIKGQDPVWITLRQDAADILTELASGLDGHDRFFWYWNTVESMRNSVEDKARRVELTGVRFHDVCKVTRISQLSKEGWSLAELEHVSNTSKKTLVDHYIKADRLRTFDKYKNHVSPLGHTGATPGPKNDSFVALNGSLGSLDSSIAKVENSSTSQPIPA